MELSAASSGSCGFSPAAVSPVTVIDEKGNTRLHQAVLSGSRRWELYANVVGNIRNEIQTLLKSGLNPNVQNREGNTVFHMIANLDYQDYAFDEIVRILIEAGATANIPNEKGETPFHCIMAKKPSVSICELLITKGFVDVNAKDKDGNTALHKVCLSTAAFYDRFRRELAEKLIESGARVEIANNEGDTPLHTALKSKFSISEAVLFFCKDSCAVINVKNNDGDTPLHLLANCNKYDVSGHKDYVNLFITKGADISLVNNKGELPLHRAYRRKGSDAIDLLVPENCLVMDSSGCYPLHLAAQEYINILNKAERDIKIDAFKLILKRSKDIVNFSDESGYTALHYAIRGGFYEAVELLIQAGVLPNILGYEWNTPLHDAVSCLLNTLRSYIGGPDLKKIDEIRTVLTTRTRFEINKDCAATNEYVFKKIINFLLDSGANPDLANKNRKSSIDLCGGSRY